METCKLCGNVRTTVSVHDLGKVCGPCLRGDQPQKFPPRTDGARIVDTAIAEAARECGLAPSPSAAQLAAEVR